MTSSLWLAPVLSVMFLAPGWALLAGTGIWRRWAPLQRWALAVGLSIAFYPALFYAVRAVLPGFTLGPYKMTALLLFCGLVVAWRLRRSWREQFALDKLEWVAVGVFVAVIFTRFWIIRDRPYPAWSDSLHHVLLTQLTAQLGQLPVTLEPYAPTPLDMYHLGLYALSATAKNLAGVPAHTALLWVSQLLNALCSVGVYLVLDRKVSRLGAIAGAVTVGLLCHQPAFYVNWGRFTQVAGQAIILIAWLVTWEAIRAWSNREAEPLVQRLAYVALAALLNSGVFLLHFRVGAFYLPLLLFCVGYELWRARQNGDARAILAGTALIGLLSLIFVLPALLRALDVYVAQGVAQAAASADAPLQQDAYYLFTWRAVPDLAARWWLLILAAGSAVLGLVKRHTVTIGAIFWAAAVVLAGNLYRLGIPLLAFTNLGAVLIMLYLPIGLVVGVAVHELVTSSPTGRQRVLSQALLFALLGAGLVVSHARVTDIEEYRYFVTAQDVEAMSWIAANTPSNARFAINTVFWTPDSSIGTDAGYWIPYFTGRETTADTMLFGLADPSYRVRILDMSRAAEELSADVAAVYKLCDLGVDYVYRGAKGDFQDAGLVAVRLAASPDLKMVYEKGGVFIWQIKPSATTTCSLNAMGRSK